jgi:hypothetical protein
MAKFKRPTNKTELEDLEAQGLWRAIALSKSVGEGNEKITLEVIQNIHKVMLKDAMPEAAGRFRVNGEDVKKLKCHEPPPRKIGKGANVRILERVGYAPGQDSSSSQKAD